MIINKGVRIKTLGEVMPAEFANRLKNVPRMYQKYDAALKEVCTKLEILDTNFEVSADHNPIHHMESRLKSPKSIRDKLRKSNLEISEDDIRSRIFDIAGIRVICNYIDDIYLISGKLCEQSDVTVVSIKDYIKEPKPSGYRSLHVTVEIPVFQPNQVENVPVEIQFRTVSMDVWASLEHELRYKSNNVLSDDQQQMLKDSALQLEKVDRSFQEIYDSVKSGRDEGNVEREECL